MCSKKLPAFRFGAAFSTLSFPIQTLEKYPPTSFLSRDKEPRNYGIQFLSYHPNPEISVFPYKGFSEITCLTTGRALHARCVKDSTLLSPIHFNTLINMYSKLGRVDAARSVFGQMPQRNEASWNTMISGYVKGGLNLDAIELFCEMRDENIHINGFVLSSLITACNNSTSMVYQGLQVHGFVIKVGFLDDVFVGTSLLHFYGTYGFTHNAQRVFEEMPERNVVSWTSLMVAHLNNGDPENTVMIYQKMRRDGASCNQNSFTTLISSCGLIEDELLGLQVLAHVVVSGLESNVSVANSLVYMFGSFGCVEDARYVFDQMGERDIISWNSLISAYSLNGFCEESLKCFNQMQYANVKPNSTTLSSLISACSSVDYLNWGRGFHAVVVKLGIDSIVCVCNTLIALYTESGRPKNAELLFLEMTERDLISWNSMMACYAQDGESRGALALLEEMFRTQKIINHVTFANALGACSSIEDLIMGKSIHALTIRHLLHENLVVGNALVTMYGKCGSMRVAELVVQSMPQRDVITWNALIGCHAENENAHEAIKAFNLMRKDGMSANYITMVNVLGGLSSPDHLLKYGMPFHAHIIITRFEADGYVKNALITMYANCGDLDSSNFIFGGLQNKHVVAWNAMIAANAHHGNGEEALKLFAEMRHAGLALDQFSFSGGLSASANLALLEEGQQLHDLVIKLGFESDLHVTNAAMNMYGKCGEMDNVLKILPKPSNRSRLSWNILISGFARHGHFEKAREAFHEMLQWGPNPDHVTFVALLAACSHGGLVDDGLAYFASMTSEFGVLPGIEHCVCIIDLLGRSGRLFDAVTFIKEMPVPTNELVWRSLLAACKIHRNFEIGRIAAENLLKLNPSDDSAYVLLSNVCAISGRWDDVENVRRQMKVHKIKKKPACSWVNVKGKVCSFGIGDRSHPQTRQIYAKLKEILNMIKEAGYVPDTSFALHDTDEEQKEHNLWNHSEKLALAFGLINTPTCLPIRVFKNLRVCGDCHSVYKFVSRVVKRDIILRDPYRFHHFNGGKCSCCDYW